MFNYVNLSSKFTLKIILALLSAGLILIVIAVNVKAETTSTATPTDWVARQHRSDACVLAAVATNLNYVSQGRNYTSVGLALAYKIKFGAENWAQDGTTSHNAQMIAEDAGFKVTFGQLGDWGGPAALKYLVWEKHYPVVFLNGSPQHAVTVLSLADDDTFLVADPWTGGTFQEQVDSFYNKLEPQKWYFSTGL